MTTKNLAKSVKEASKTRSYAFDRKLVNRKGRHHAKQTIADFVNHENSDPEEFSIDQEPTFQSWMNLRLTPLYNFLRSKIGQPWNDVYSEIKKSFVDASSQKLIHEKMLPRVNVSDSGRDNRGRIFNPEVGEIDKEFSYKNHRRYPNLYVDGDGLLQDVTAHVNYDKVTLEDKKDIAKFLDNRVIVKLGDTLHWCFPKNGFWKIDIITKKDNRNYYVYSESYYDRQEISLLKEEVGEYTEKVPALSDGKTWWGGSQFDLVDKTRSGLHWVEKEVAEGFVPRGPLNDKELEQFNKFNSKCQELMMSFGRGISN